MATHILILMIAGAILALVGGIGLLIQGFRESVLWGLGMLLLPIVSLIFVVTHWSRAKNPFLLQLAGVALLCVAVFLSGGMPTA